LFFESTPSPHILKSKFPETKDLGVSTRKQTT
jgi:hypothetical protein